MCDLKECVDAESMCVLITAIDYFEGDSRLYPAKKR